MVLEGSYIRKHGQLRQASQILPTPTKPPIPMLLHSNLSPIGKFWNNRHLRSHPCIEAVHA